MSDSRLTDDINANLKLSHYLFEHAFYEGAIKWCEISLDKGQRLAKKKAARNLVVNYYSKEEIKQLLRMADVYFRLKWLCLYMPGIYPVLRTMKQMLRRIA